MKALLEGLLSNVVWALLGALAVFLSRLLFRVQPTRRLWRLRKPGGLVICASSSGRADTMEYIRPMTGIGQLQALAVVMGSLNRAYKGVQVRNILLSDSELMDLIENDLILLGGPKNNKVSRLLLDKIAAYNVVDQEDVSAIVWKPGDNEERFAPEVKDKKVTRDYGLIVRMTNPFSSGDSAIALFSGTHTYGTVAAARFFAENFYREAQRFKKVGPNLATVVSCDVKDGYPVGVKLERKAFF